MVSSWKEFRKQGKLPEDEQIRKLGLLVVDDESEIVESLKEVFSSHFEIYHSTSAEKALEMFKEHAPKIVLSDQRMPEMTGIELLRKIKEINPSTRRILITGYSDINVVIDALNDGLLWKYVAKPWDHDELRKLVLKGARQYLQDEGLDEQEYGFNPGFMGL